MFIPSPTPRARAATGGSFDVSTISYVQSFDFSAQTSRADGVFFKPDGTKMFLAARTGNDILEYALSTAWDISSATYTDLLDVGTQEAGLRDLAFSDDGSKLYICGDDTDVNEYTLSTAWDVSTGTFNQNYSAPNSGNTRGMSFGDSGTKMYIADDVSNQYDQYSLSTPWTLSTAAYVNTVSIVSQDGSPRTGIFNSDGSKFIHLGSDGNDLTEYSLTTNWDITTLTFVQTSSTFTTQDTDAEGIYISPNGLKLYVVGQQNDKVYEYDME